jgi:CheY-like chemotaxis protein
MKNGLPFTILMVEDDADDREIIDEAFKEVGYESEIKKFIDGEALLKYLEEVDETVYPSLIVLDNRLPKLDVQDLLSILKEDERFKSISVVIYAGSLSNAAKDILFELGAYAIIEKGSTMQSIVDIARELKEIAESEKEQTRGHY